MGAQTEIDRIKAAKDDIIAALTEKTITVPEKAKIEALADLVRSIPKGAQVASGTFTGSSIATTTTINGMTFACPFIPSEFVISYDFSSVPGDESALIVGIYRNSKWAFFYGSSGTLKVTSGTPNGSAYPSFSLSGETLKITCSTSISTYRYLAIQGRSATFLWYAIG